MTTHVPEHLGFLAADGKISGFRPRLPSDGGKSEFSNAFLKAVVEYQDAQRAFIKAAAKEIVEAIVEKFVKGWLDELASRPPLVITNSFRDRLKLQRLNRPFRPRVRKPFTIMPPGGYASGGVVGKSTAPRPLIDPNKSLFPKLSGKSVEYFIVDDLDCTKTRESCKPRFKDPASAAFVGYPVIADKFTIAEPGKIIAPAYQCVFCCDLGYTKGWAMTPIPFEQRLPCPAIGCKARSRTLSYSYTIQAPAKPAVKCVCCQDKGWIDTFPGDIKRSWRVHCPQRCGVKWIGP